MRAKYINEDKIEPLDNHLIKNGKIYILPENQTELLNDYKEVISEKVPTEVSETQKIVPKFYLENDKIVIKYNVVSIE